MSDSFNYDFNLNKANQSIGVFIVSSAILACTIFYFSKLSIPEALKIILALMYFLYILVLLRRLFFANYQIKPRIELNEEYLIMPTFHLGLKKIKISDIYSIELFPNIRKNEILLLGVKDIGRILVDQSLFLSQFEFNDFKSKLKKSFQSNKPHYLSESTLKISERQQRQAPLFTLSLSIAFLVLYFVSTSGTLDVTDKSLMVLEGAAAKSIFSDGEIYRIATSIFFHLSIWHLLLNILVLGVMGDVLEKVIGIVRFSNIFFVSNIISCFAFVIFSNLELGVGSSGAVFGLWGAYLALKLRYEKLLPGSVNVVSVRRLMLILIVELAVELIFLNTATLIVHLAGFFTGFSYFNLTPLGQGLENIDQASSPEKVFFGSLIAFYFLALTYFLLMFYGVI